MAVTLIVAGLIVFLAALLTCLASVMRGRARQSNSITEAQARENAAPLTTAIRASAVASERACQPAHPAVAPRFKVTRRSGRARARRHSGPGG